jgi:glycosyltransferase involved in cell wall biosynthesis
MAGACGSLPHRRDGMLRTETGEPLPPPHPVTGDPAPIRLAVLNSHPIQYFAPLYAYLNATPQFDVTALYMSDSSLRGDRDPGFGQSVTWDVDLLAGYRSIFVGGDKAQRRTPGRFFSLVAPEVWREVRRGGYDALVVHGHHYAANLIAIAAAKSVGIPVLMRGDGHLGILRGGLRRRLRRPAMNLLYRIVDRFMAVGAENAAYYRAMGAPQDKIFVAPFSVDNERFVSASTMTVTERRKSRDHFGIPQDSPAILYAAKFAQRKHPDDLLRATVRLREITPAPFAVVMCGTGEMEPELRAYCADQGLENVVFTGFVNQAELPKLYGCCDVFVLPSENEPWGLAVNEAMCAALPVVVSREVGCVVDLVRDGGNGFAPEAGDIEGWAQALRRLIEDADFRKRAGAASLERISRWSYREVAEAFARALGLRTDEPRGREPQRHAFRVAAGAK